ncbi:MAG: VOC family protein [Solirubrobacteraceae bacterium]
MGTRNHYEAGTFSWTDLTTSDVGGAKAFYAKVFGWDYDDLPAGENHTYSMANVDGATVAAIQSMDGPPRWNAYITVESADDAAEKAKEAGAEIHAGPFDVMEAGRMLVIQEPSGSVVSAWEPKENPGAGLVNVHGAMTWNDLQTHDVDKAVQFYTEMFGWEVAPLTEDDESGRMVIRNGDRLNGGMAKMPEELGTEVPPHWLTYFAVDDIDAATAAIVEGGGEVVAGPLDIPAGKLAVAADPQGAVFGVFAGELDD